MAYATSNPPACIAQRVGANGGSLYMYKDGDTLALMLGVNYFRNAADLGMKAGDRLIAIDDTNFISKDLTMVDHAEGTAVGALGSSIEAIGVTSIALQSAGTGSILINDIITFDNDPALNEYRVTVGDADVSGGGTLTITPGLVVATAVGTGIVVRNNVLNASMADASALISGVGATRTLTAAEAGSTALFDRAAGIVYTLPTPVVGMKFRFETTVDLTTNAYAIVTDAGTTFIVGAVNGAIEGAATGEVHFANGTTHVGVSSNKTTTGGLIGGWLELEAISSTLWSIRGVLSCTVTPAPPFTT